jgi:hypothetical protein
VVSPGNVTFNLPPDTICDNAAPLMLSGGSPPGGVFSGVGVNSGYFFPALASLGFNRIYYDYNLHNCSKTLIDSIFVDNCTMTGISKSGGEKIIVYPNPVTSELYIILENINGSARITLTDIIGREVINENKNVKGEEQLSYNMGELKDGIYLLSVLTDGQTIFRKIVKSH